MASPATVSRCGMVYVTPSDLGWRPYFYSWRDKFLIENLSSEKLDFLVNLFEMFIDLCFDKVEKYRSSEVMNTTEIQNVQDRKSVV